MSVVSKSLAEQHEVDGVAFFVEAATQLARSKFYIEEHINLGFSGISKDGQFVLTGLTFPAPEVRDSILFPFRRIWMEEEPCFFFKVLNTLKRYAVHWQERLDSFHAIHSQGLKQFMCPFALRFSTLSPRDVINLWLNTRFAHVSSSVTKGKRSIFTKGKPSSSDFAKHEQMIGAPQFEYLFYNALLNLGFDYIH